MIRIEARPEVHARSTLGEGPIWCDGRLIWVDLLEGRLLARAGEGTDELLRRETTLSVALPRHGGGLVLLAGRRIEILDAGHRVERVVTVELAPGERLADATAGPAGELWFGSVRDDLGAGGCLYRLRPGDDRPESVIGGLGMPNGLGFSPDGRTLYFVDSAAGTVTAYDYEPDTQEISRPAVIATIDPADGVPDGIAVDAAGSVWVALWSAGCVRRLDPDGVWSQEILVPAPNVTSCAFGGPGLGTLYITTGTVEMDETALAESPLAGFVFATPVPVPGTPLAEVRL